MELTERVRALCEPVASELDVELFDIERSGNILRITIDRAGGVDLAVVAEATRQISRLLDEHDPVPGRYTLEVSSPGLERALRTPEHFRWALGKPVTVKTLPQVEGDRRVRGTVAAADRDTVTIACDEPAGSERRLRYDDIDRARTIFEWGPTPKPGGGGQSRSRAHRRDHEVETS